MKLLGANYRCAGGEIDIIALQGATRDNPLETIVFVEVKTRSSDAYTDPSSAVDSEKRRRVKKAARYYLSTRPTEDYNVRFDIVSVVLRAGGKPEVNHIIDAFR
jgi:putative endonuclease